jgi:ABC-type bacteriocin/lantibiotic exporter with double-glycine peptidase domain
MLGIFGPSGSGKSTFVDILLGLLTPTDGEVLVDGEPVDLSKSTWMNQAGYVPQEIYLLDDSIRNNIAFGLERELISDSRILDVMKLAQIDEFVNSLPDGLETSIGERGSRLSGGQRQRIGIARALYNKPRLLILDEATSALDIQSESDFIESLEQIRSGITVVIISHKDSTLKYCDRIFKMQYGKLVKHN